MILRSGATQQAGSRSAAGAREGRTVRRPLARITLANLGCGQIFYLSLLVILPDQSLRVGGSAHKTDVLALVAAIGALVALAAAIGAGHLSDRRRAATGSRGGVLAVGAVLTGVLLAVLPATASVPWLLVVWCGAQLGLNGVLSVVTAALADWFSVERRGLASAYAALGQVLGAALASLMVVLLAAHPAAAAALGGLIFVLSVMPMVRPPYDVVTQTMPDDQQKTENERAPDQADAPAAPGPQGERRGRGLYVDVALAWAVRVVVTFSNTLVVTFLNYYVTDVLRPADPQRLVGLAAGLTSLMVAAGAVVSGRASDRSQRRRPFVIAAVLLMCAGELLLAGWRSVPGAFVAAAVIGAGYGVYLAVDQALSADVLPNSHAYGRDFGIMNTATSAPQIIAPAVAAVLLGGSKHYSVLFVVGALTVLSGAGFVLPIKRVR
ncbi:MAG TPA: MFS transporter [Actinocrinis sp.]